jgi:type II secretory pathway component PulF
MWIFSGYFLSSICTLKKTGEEGGGMAQAVEHLPNESKALSSNPIRKKKKKLSYSCIQYPCILYVWLVTGLWEM